MRASGASASRGVLDRVGEEKVLAVVRVDCARGRPISGGFEISEIEGVDEVACDDGVGDGSVAEIGGEATTGHGAGGGEAGVLVGGYLEG